MQVLQEGQELQQHSHKTSGQRGKDRVQRERERKLRKAGGGDGGPPALAGASALLTHRTVSSACACLRWLACLG